jgi:hypothetical protein
MTPPEEEIRLLAARLVREYAEARHQRHSAQFDCGRCDLTAALRAAAHEIEEGL